MLEHDKLLQQFAVIGLGRFGLSVAKTLFGRGHEVFGIDHREEAVQEAKDVLTHSVQASLHDVELVRELGLDEMDAVVVAIGDEVEANIFTTTLLLEAGARHVVARANTALHALILERIGAHQIVYPEQDSGEAVARGLRARDVTEHIELAPNVGISKLRAPDAWCGRSVDELRLSKADPTFIALVIQRGDETFVLPDPGMRIEVGDTLAIFAQESKLDEILPPPRHRR